MRELTTKQKVFVEEYLSDFNASRAARKAGYSAKTAETIAYQQLQKTSVRAALSSALAKRAAKSERDALDVLLDIRRVVTRAMAEGDHRSALKGLELEGKHLGMFERHNAQRRPLVSIVDFTNGQRSVTAGVTADPAPVEPAE